MTHPHRHITHTDTQTHTCSARSNRSPSWSPSASNTRKRPPSLSFANAWPPNTSTLRPSALRATTGYGSRTANGCTDTAFGGNGRPFGAFRSRPPGRRSTELAWATAACAYVKRPTPPSCVRIRMRAGPGAKEPSLSA
eukprot:2392743-Rhodomonas_salina.1